MIIGCCNYVKYSINKYSYLVIIYIYITFIVVNFDVILQMRFMSQPPGQPADGQHKCHTKRHLEFKQNVVGHMTFVGWLTCQSETYHA